MLTGAVLPEDSSWDGRPTSQWPCSYGCWPLTSPQDLECPHCVVAGFFPKEQGESGDEFTNSFAGSLGHTGRLCSAWGGGRATRQGQELQGIGPVRLANRITSANN